MWLKPFCLIDNTLPVPATSAAIILSINLATMPPRLAAGRLRAAQQSRSPSSQQSRSPSSVAHTSNESLRPHNLDPHPAGSNSPGRKRSLQDIVHSRKLSEQEAQNKEPERFIDSKWFSIAVHVTITINAVVMGLSVDHTGETLDTVWAAFEHFFTGAFTLEMICKLWVLRGKYFTDAWNLVDGILVIMAVTDMWVLPLAAVTSSGLRNMTILRLIRILRVIRLVRFLRMFEQLWVLVVGILASFKTMSWVCLLLLGLIYSCAISCTQIIGHEESYPGYNKDHVDQEHNVASFNN